MKWSWLAWALSDLPLGPFILPGHTVMHATACICMYCYWEYVIAFNKIFISYVLAPFFNENANCFLQQQHDTTLWWHAMTRNPSST
jgi:hypothetical protein